MDALIIAAEDQASQQLCLKQTLFVRGWIAALFIFGTNYRTIMLLDLWYVSHYFVTHSPRKL